MNISEKQSEFALEVEKTLREKGFRVKTDLRNEKIGFKIREHTLQKVPFLLVVGDKEVESRQVAVRTRCGKNLDSLSLDEFIATLEASIALRGRVE
ncbi:MAG: threonine--tRNA ligase, partial [Gammaproteobacteria bacterium]|nr:threonine--tRNA ligase [Gammaproteobacteria bacterium]